MSILSSQIPILDETHYVTNEGIEITRRKCSVDLETATETILKEIDRKKGALFSSRYEYPGRYSRWDAGFYNPLLEIRSNGNKFSIYAQNQRGEILLNPIGDKLQSVAEITSLVLNKTSLTGTIQENHEVYDEEKRSQQPSIFTIIRAIKSLFASSEDSFLGFYGAFGYDLVFQFEPMKLKNHRHVNDSDIVLYIPDELVIVDHQLESAYQLSYEFSYEGKSTTGIPRDGEPAEYNYDSLSKSNSYQPGNYADMVRKAIKSFKKGDLFEVVPSHSLFEKYESTPSEVFTRLQRINPSPYGFIINLGTEFLVGSSPEMYVRVEGDRVETCPISGTIKRGKNAIEDADQIRTLLNSSKDEAELTMCTDVDRNDKSRICEPGSVNVIGRRQIEMYSHLIHTVDHVEGHLRPEFDALDAFLTHMWAVTITGAPKRAAIRWIEDHERSPRGWYGGAVGWFNFDGSLNTGLTLRTMKLKNGLAEIRVGATLLYDSVPEDEEQETLTKAAGLLQAIRETNKGDRKQSSELYQSGKGKKILIVDHEDSFVHTLANYMKQTGAEVLTLRTPKAQEAIRKNPSFDLVVLSPGPGKPEQFHVSDTINLCLERDLPLFGVCLGLQGIVEHFGGSLNILDYPQHGKPAIVRQTQQSYLWDGLPEKFKVSRYHSLYAEKVPENIDITAFSDDDVVMAIQHKELPISAVQFHPESILTTHNNMGLKMIDNVMKNIKKKNQRDEYSL
ncbi:anthranilate synthase component I [Priestia aryabhattai]|uniref:anthranilate synthase component I n=1 Tax=Priestia aryabhattai TaxID=412384 RepID=UPI002E1CF157|nr:anthranilate synthase component I [Priestia aryabhattai]MED4156655.1 anthranilate synthase component I [Priestia aryabhattai]